VCVIRKSAEENVYKLILLCFTHNIQVSGMSERSKPKVQYSTLLLYSDSSIYYYINPSHLFVFECIVTELPRRISRKFRNPFAIYRNPNQCVERQGSSSVPVFVSRTLTVVAGHAEALNNPVCCRFYICTLRIYFDNFQFRTRMLCTLRMEWFYCISV